MSVSEMLGGKGIFVSDEALDHLNITLDRDVFNELKKHVKAGSEEGYKCYVTNKFVTKDMGIFIPPEMMADALQKNLDSAAELDRKFKEDGVYVDENGHEQSIDSMTNSEKKKYSKKIHLPLTRRLAIRGYIKFLKGQIKNMPG